MLCQNYCFLYVLGTLTFKALTVSVLEVFLAKVDIKNIFVTRSTEIDLDLREYRKKSKKTNKKIR